MRILFFKCNTWPAGFPLPPSRSRNNRPGPPPPPSPTLSALARAARGNLPPERAHPAPSGAQGRAVLAAPGRGGRR